MNQVDLDCPDLLEALAAVEHERWSNWEKYRATQTKGSKRWVSEKRWKRQRETPYAQLSEKEKESDRVEARKSIAVIRNASEAGAKEAMAAFGVEHVPMLSQTTSPHGRAGAIDQAFRANAAMGEASNSNGGLPSATNNILSGGLVGAPGLPRRFEHPTDQSGDAL